MQAGLKQVSGYGFGLLALAGSFLLTVFLLWPYGKLQPVFQQFNAEKQTLFPWNDFKGTYGFSEKTYWTALGGYAIIAVFSMVLFLWLRKPDPRPLFHSLIATFHFYRRKIIRAWQELPLWEKWLVVLTGLLLTGVRLYFLFTSRIGGDEAASYIFFISKGLPGIMLYYPLPNNHIFYNLLCLPLRYLFADPYWTVELPTFGLSLLGSALIYLAYRRVLPFLVVFFASVTFCFSQYALYFSVHGRGYFLVSICAALVAFALYKIYQGRDTYRYWLVFMAGSVVGFYAIPVFLYPFAATGIFAAVVWLKARNLARLKELILAGAFTALVTLLLYSPVLLASGAKLLFANHYIISDPFTVFYKRFLFFLTYTQGAVVGQESFGFYLWLLGFAGIPILLLFRSRLTNRLSGTLVKPALLLLVWCNLALPWGFTFLQRVRPPERVLFYKGFFDLLAIGVILYAIGYLVLRRFPKLLTAGFLVLVASYSGYQVHKAIRNEQIPILDEGFDARLRAIIASGAATIYGNEIYYTANLRYEYFKHGPPGFFLSEYEFNPNLAYDVLVLNKKNPVLPLLNLKNYRLAYENEFVRIFYSEDFLTRKGRLPILK